MIAARLISSIVEYRAVAPNRVVIRLALKHSNSFLACQNSLPIKPPAPFLRNQNRTVNAIRVISEDAKIAHGGEIHGNFNWSETGKTTQAL